MNRRYPLRERAFAALALVPIVACGGGSTSTETDGGTGITDGGNDGGTTVTVPTRYEFPSRYDSAASSVAYNGQAFRWLLISDLKSYIESLGTKVDTQQWSPAAGEVVSGLNFYFDFNDAAATGVPVALQTTPPLLLTNYEQYPSRPNLKAKLAGIEKVGPHRDWTTQFVGFGATSPEGLLLRWFDTLEAQTVTRANGTVATDPAGKPLDAPYLTADGLNLSEGVQKLLSSAMAFSQATDKYLDDDVAGEGLLVENVRDGDKPYTKLEHYWDEGFGYFGASRDMMDYTLEELANTGGRTEYKGGKHDTDGDGKLDLLKEINFAFVTYAARRDVASKADAKTDYARTAMQGFLKGRAIIAAAPEGTLSAEAMAQLKAARDEAVGAWEASLAATTVSYLNRLLVEMNKVGTADYTFASHAKYWSEMKLISIALQFNPRSRLTADQFATLQSKLGERPVLTGTAELAAYRAQLLEARALLGSAYGFAAENLGDENGIGGW